MDKKEILIYVLLLMAFVGWGFVVDMQNTAIAQIKLDTNTLAGLVDAQTNGKRVDAFRCSDAERYFDEVGVAVDCAGIESDVNK